MILKDNFDTAIRVGDIRNMNKIVSGNDSTRQRYSIEVRFKHATSSMIYKYESDEDARDADFVRLNRHMDALDGIQQ